MFSSSQATPCSILLQFLCTPRIVFLTTRIEKRFSSPLFVSFETSHAREGLFFRGTPDNSPP